MKASSWKAEQEAVCICDSKGCFMVLNVADRTGSEPSPGTRTSLQVTSRVDSTVKMMLHKQLTKHILPPSRCNTFVLLICFSFLYFYNVLAITKDVNTKQKDNERLNHYMLTICNRHMMLRARMRAKPADPNSL